MIVGFGFVILIILLLITAFAVFLLCITTI